MFTEMVSSVVNRSEQRQLAALFVALDGAVDLDPKFAGSVTFWRHQLHAGVDPSHLAELLEVLDALSASQLNEDHIQLVRRWQLILQSRTTEDQQVSPSRAARISRNRPRDRAL
jgi:hypothetical protein